MEETNKFFRGRADKMEEKASENRRRLSIATVMPRRSEIGSKVAFGGGDPPRIPYQKPTPMPPLPPPFIRKPPLPPLAGDVDKGGRLPEAKDEKGQEDPEEFAARYEMEMEMRAERQERGDSSRSGDRSRSGERGRELKEDDEMDMTK